MSKIQDKGLSLDREDLDAQLQAAADKQKKAKRKKKIRRRTYFRWLERCRRWDYNR